MYIHNAPFRLPPKLPVTAVKSYEILAPKSTHTRVATCAEVECLHSLKGWRTIVDVGTPLGAAQANYIRLHSGRHFTVTEDGSLVTFHFPGGQTCFAQHRVSLERPEIFRVRPGDYRGTTGDIRVHVRPDDWVDDFANHQIKLAKAHERG